jgi:hypothetical protein
MHKKQAKTGRNRACLWLLLKDKAKAMTRMYVIPTVLKRLAGINGRQRALIGGLFDTLRRICNSCLSATDLRKLQVLHELHPFNAGGNETSFDLRADLRTDG